MSRGWGLVLTLLAAVGPAAAEPVADVHLHYNWDQAELITPAAAVARLKQQQVVLAVVTGMPPELALEIRQAGGDWVLPLYGPYGSPAARSTWHLDTTLVGRARQALASGKYVGLGEIHLISGVRPGRDNPVFNGLMALADEFDAPVLLHTEAADPRYFIDICRRHPAVRILWAHAGGLLGADAAHAVLQRCPNVWIELSARDPWRYTRSPITDAEGNLLPGWRSVIMEHPGRFMIGSDPVWPVTQRFAWDQADTGWDRLEAFLDFHRRWLAGLPPDLARRVRLDNALAFFRTGPGAFRRGPGRKLPIVDPSPSIARGPSARPAARVPGPGAGYRRMQPAGD